MRRRLERRRTPAEQAARDSYSGARHIEGLPLLMGLNLQRMDSEEGQLCCRPLKAPPRPRGTEGRRSR